MFTWVCPQCGREVPPHYDECPDCKGKTAAPPAGQPQQPAAPAGYPPPPPPPQQFPPAYYQQPAQAPPGQPYYPPPQQAPYQPQQAPPPGPQYYAPPPQHQQAPPPPSPPQYYQPQQHQAPPQYYPQQPQGNLFSRMPAWMLTILFAVGIGGIIFGIYSVLQTGKPAAAGTGPAPAAVVESPAAKPGGKPNPLQKQIEISGVRFSQDAKKKTLVTFMVTNHSTAEINGLAGNVTIWGRTQKSEEDAQGTFTFTTDLAPFQAKELSAPLNSKLKIYELPDWQNITTDIQITSPAG